MTPCDDDDNGDDSDDYMVVMVMTMMIFVYSIATLCSSTIRLSLESSSSGWQNFRLVIVDKAIDHLAELFKAWFGEAEHSQRCRFPCRKRMISKHKEIVVISHGKRTERMRKRMISKQDEIVARS